MFDFGEFADYNLTEKVTIICSIVLLLALIVATVVVFIRNRKSGSGDFSTHDITYGAICLAISFALSFIGVTMPQGGTITPASSLAIMLYCYFFGFRKGFVVCFAYMLLQFLQSPYIVHPMSAVLDYIIPYLSLIFFGIFSIRKKNVGSELLSKNPLKRDYNFLIAAVAYMAIRYTCHVVSGIIFYAEYALEAGMEVNAYSFAYNSFFLIDAAVAVIAGMVLLANRSFYKLMGEKSIATPVSQ